MSKLLTRIPLGMILIGMAISASGQEDSLSLARQPLSTAMIAPVNLHVLLDQSSPMQQQMLSDGKSFLRQLFNDAHAEAQNTSLMIAGAKGVHHLGGLSPLSAAKDRVVLLDKIAQLNLGGDSLLASSLQSLSKYLVEKRPLDADSCGYDNILLLSAAISDDAPLAGSHAHLRKTQAFKLQKTWLPAVAEYIYVQRKQATGVIDFSQSENLLKHTAFAGNGAYIKGVSDSKAFNDVKHWLDQVKYLSAAKLGEFVGSTVAEDNYLYQTTFDTRDWSGDLRKFAFHKPLAQPMWSANKVAAQGNNYPVITWHPLTYTTMPFTWKALQHKEPEHPLLQDLGLNVDQPYQDNLERRVAVYTHKQGLGANVHARPVLLRRERQNNWHDDLAPQLYSQWQPRRQRKTIWQASNDGMLHAFDDESGRRLLAYVPAFLASTQTNAGLHTQFSRYNSRRFLLDATPAIYDAFYQRDWRTVVVGTAGAGAKGIYALEVTEPISDSRVLWEFVHPDLGYSLATPVVGKMPNGRWAVMVNNGYQNDTGNVSLFIIYLDADLSDGWNEGEDYLQISVASGSKDNGLSALTVLGAIEKGSSFSTKVKEVETIYAGDLLGSLWRFDFSAASKPFKSVQSASVNTKVQQVFQTQQRQPIIMAPEIQVRQQCGRDGCEDEALLAISTGKFIFQKDRQDRSMQSLYVIRDDNASKTIRRNQLRKRTRTEPEETADDGWYFDFPHSGERGESFALIQGNNVLFQSWQPDSEFCSASGKSRLYSFSLWSDHKPDNLSAARQVNNDDIERDQSEGYQSYFGSGHGALIWRANASGDISKIANLPTKKPFEGVLRWQELIDE